MKFDGTEKEIIVDTEELVTIIRLNEEMMKDMKISPITRKYQDVNKNGIKFVGKNAIEAKSRGINFNLPRLFTEREDIKPLREMDWLRDFNWTLRTIETTTTITNHSEKDKKKQTLKK